MKICAVICELNPLHNGHRYIFEKAREATGADRLIALMSGHFVQRGTPAVTDAYSRAECALACGADAVIELPVVYAVAAADKFASGAVNILRTLPVDTLVCGAESDNGELIDIAAHIRAEEPETYKSALRACLDGGLSYGCAVTEATAAAASAQGADGESVRAMLSKPNNILAVSYRKAIVETQSDMDFVTIKRAGGDISESFSGTFSSASAIRKILDDDTVSAAMPAKSFEVLRRERKEHFVRSDEFGALMLAALRDSAAERIEDTPDCAEGFSVKIKKLADSSASFDDFMFSVPTSRFTRGRIMRICLQNLLRITKEMQASGYNCARLIGVRRGARDILGLLPQNIITDVRSESAIPAHWLPCYEAEKRASDIYSLIAHRPAKFRRRLITAD